MEAPKTMAHGKGGQTILEYLLVVSLIIAALVAARSDTRDAIDDIIGESVSKLEDVADEAANLPVGADETP